MHSQVTGSGGTPLHWTILGRESMVASSHELASFFGAKTLAGGGNPVDAAITTSAMLCVTQNNLCGLGGDLFALVKREGRIWNLNGSGRASRNATIRFYLEEKKLEQIPHRGPLGAPTVPGIVHAWGELHSKFASMDWKELLAPAIDYAKNGFPITSNYSRSIASSAEFLGAFEEWSKIFLPGNKVSEAGYVLKQKDLASSLELIAREGPESFYSGALAEKLVKGIEKQGGLVDAEDLKNHTSTWQTPLKTNYRGLDVYETAPNSQAATVLIWLNMLEEFDLKRYSRNSPELFEILLDTCLKAYQTRAEAIADPAFLAFKENFLSREYAKQLLNSNLTLSSKLAPSSESSSDTTYFTVGNAEGDALSVIQSNYMGFGSGLVPEGTGIGLHNRGCYFSLNRNHHNSLEPGKRTFHTLCASMGESETSKKTAFSLGCMGGDIQPQVHVQLITNLLDYHMDLQEAIDSPRWVVPFSIYEKPATVYFEPGLSTPHLGQIARSRGLAFEQLDSLSSLTGHAQAIQFEDKYLKGAADPRGDGIAIGF